MKTIIEISVLVIGLAFSGFFTVILKWCRKGEMAFQIREIECETVRNSRRN